MTKFSQYGRAHNPPDIEEQTMMTFLYTFCNVYTKVHTYFLLYFFNTGFWTWSGKAPGRKTLAKERLFNHILGLIRDVDEVEVFEIDKSTLPDTAKERWRMLYRHWRFVPAEFRKSGI